jgi:Mg2+ and Co2+ transporter CorA
MLLPDRSCVYVFFFHFTSHSLGSAFAREQFLTVVQQLKLKELFRASHSTPNRHAAAVTCWDYSPDLFDAERPLTDAHVKDWFFSARPEWSRVRWVNLDRMDTLMLHRVAVKYHLHPLAVEDALTVGTRVKCDYYENHLYLCVPAFPLDDNFNAASNGKAGGFQKVRDFIHSPGTFFKQHQRRSFSGNSRRSYGSSDESEPLFSPSPSPSGHQIMPAGDDSAISGLSEISFPEEETAGQRAGSNRMLRFLRSPSAGPPNGSGGGSTADQVEQISIFLVNSNQQKNDRYDTVITTQQFMSDRLWLKAIERIRMPYSKLRQNDGGFLLYILFDTIVDDMMVRVEKFASLLHEWEEIVHDKSSTPQDIAAAQQGCHALKAVIRRLQRKLRPLREVVNRLLQDSEQVFQLGVDSKTYFRDVADHLVQVCKSCPVPTLIVLSASSSKQRCGICILHFLSDTCTIYGALCVYWHDFFLWYVNCFFLTKSLENDKPALLVACVTFLLLCKACSI